MGADRPAPVDHTTYRRVAAVRERATRVVSGPAPVFPMPSSIPAIRYADRHTAALLERLGLEPRRFNAVFSALTEAFDSGVASVPDGIDRTKWFSPPLGLGDPDAPRTGRGI